jgi:serine/threonine protein kinase
METRSVFGSDVPDAKRLGVDQILIHIEPGRVLFERYLIERELGRGGMGIVWLVRHLDLDTLRALKTIVGAIMSSTEVSSRFRREARIMARFSHPNAVTVHDARFAQGLTFIDMEYIRGQPISHLLTPGVPMPLDWTARILEQLCDVLQVAHEQGIVHRDIKPSNLMLLGGRPDGREFLKVLDFGISKIMGIDDESHRKHWRHEPGPESNPDNLATQHGSFIGTPAYTSPEQVLGRADTRSDLYSAGVVLYELLTGHRPWGGSNMDVLRFHLNETPPPFTAKNPDVKVPHEIEQLVLRCLAKDPNDRPQSARELAEQFLWALPPRFQVSGTRAQRAELTRLRPPPGYELIEFLGSGGFGEVWMAEDREGVRVALKYVPLDKDAGQSEWNALQSIKNIRHPSLLVPFKSWQSQDHLIIGMELAEGTLDSRFMECRARGQAGIDRGELIEYLQEAAKGLDFLNEHKHVLSNGRRGGIYHCDIKPQNILLMGGGVKVADFGLSRFTAHSTTGHEAGMTLYYAAPEILNRRAARQSDQYSLAVTYCRLRGGRFPFEGSYIEVMRGHLDGVPDLSMLPREEQPILHRALSKNPRQRWPNCRAFVEALADVGLPNSSRLGPRSRGRFGSAWTRIASVFRARPTLPTASDVPPTLSDPEYRADKDRPVE